MMSQTLEVIRQRIEMTERYHEAKENLGWLGSTVYYGFCLASVAFLLSRSGPITLCRGIAAVVLCIGLFSAAITFINLQFRMRWNANRREHELDALLANLGESYTVQEHMRNYLRIEKSIAQEKRCCRQMILAAVLWPLSLLTSRRLLEQGEYRTEIPSYAIAWYLLLAQVAVLAYKVLDP